MYNRNTAVLIIIFNRPDAAKKVFAAVKQVRPKKLYIAGDGPRVQHPMDLKLCLDSREISTMVDWDCEVSTLYREKNLGCRNSVSDAISWFFSLENEGIILEDDCIPNKSFFGFCSILLERYRDEDKVMHIGGQNFLGNQKDKDVSKSFYFSLYPHIWGWATWRKSWKHFNDPDGFDEECLRKLIASRFKSCSQASRLLKSYKFSRNGVLNTWDYQWQIAILINNGFAVTPLYNLVVNIGLDYGGTHSFIKDSLRDNFSYDTISFPLMFPEYLVVDDKLDREEYSNVLTYGINRLFRLFMENRLPVLFNHSVKRLKAYFHSR